MNELRNAARDRLAKGEVALGVGIRMSRTVEIAKILQRAGYDWLFIDLEHGVMSLDCASQISIAALDCGIAPIVRVPNGEYSMATRLLDNGALGIVVPHVESADEAREIVQRLKFPPLGRRSIASNVPQFAFQPPSVDVLIATLNAVSLTVVMIETQAGVDNAAAIAAVPGVDVLLIGSNDLCLDLGIAGQSDHPRVQAAYAAVLAACRANGKWAGMGGIRSPSLIRRHIDAGIQFVLAGTDVVMLANAAQLQAEDIVGKREADS